MKNIIFFFLLLSIGASSQSLYIPSNPDSIKVPVNVNGAVRTVYNIDLIKYRAALTARDTAAALRLLIAGNTSAIGAKLNIADTIPLHTQIATNTSAIATNTSNISTNTANITANMQPIWKRKGVVMAAGKTADQDNVFEPTVIVEGNPQILTSLTTVFKMWYTSGWATPIVNYAESPDGVTWTQYASNPVVTNHSRNNVIKSGSTYVMYAALSVGGQVDRLTSTNGVTWTLANSAVVTMGAAGSWNAGSLHNNFVFIEGGVWKMIVEGRNTTGPYSLGYYTSADGITWTAYAGNPVLTGISPGGPFVTKVGSTYWLWCHGSGGSAILPSDVYRYSSPDMVTWTAQGGMVLPRREADEGVNNVNGQLADPFLVSVGNSTYLYYEGSSNGNLQAGTMKIKLAIASMPLATLVTTPEGDNGEISFGASNSTLASPATTSTTLNGGFYTTVENKSNGSAAAVGYNVKNDVGDAVNISMYSSTHGAYGAFLSGEASMYATKNLAFMTDNASAYMKFATGGNTEKMRLTANGNLLLNTTTDASSTYKLQVNGIASATQYKLSALNTAPASATATGALGEIRIDAGFIYVCTATNTWVRAALTTW